MCIHTYVHTHTHVCAHARIKGTRTGKIFAKCHCFFKSEKLVRTDKSKNLHNLESFHLILDGKQNFRFQAQSRVCTVCPKLDVFSKCSKYIFCCFITQHVKQPQQWSLYEVIEDILPFLLNTQRPLSKIWLPRYKQNSFGCF